VPHHQPKNVGAPSAERDADTKLAPSRCDGVGHDAVDPDQRDREGQAREHRHHGRDLSRARKRFGDRVLQRHHAERGKQGIDVSEFGGQRSRRRARVAGDPDGER